MKKLGLCLISIVSVLLTACFYSQAGEQTSAFNSSVIASASLSDRVRASFANDPMLSALPIKIEAQGGVVSLTGYVKTIRQSDTAQAVATQVPGVKMVQNQLIVKK